MKPWIGKYPYAPHWDKVGQKISGKGYPKIRHVMPADAIFGVLMLLIPLLTFLILENMIDK